MPLIVIGLLAVGACAPVPSPVESSAPSIGPSPVQAGSLPPGCEPIDLRAPDGERVVLDGTWTQDVAAGNPPVTWWIRTMGDCVWGAGKVEETPTVAKRPDYVQQLQGRIGTDFVIAGEIVLLGPTGIYGSAPIYSTVQLVIEFDNGEVLVREDRVAGVEGPRCTLGYCLSPLVLRLIAAPGT